MEFYVLASGSKGNATFVYEGNTGILIDCGISKRQLVNKLNSLGYSMDDINYVLLTHDHSDHNKNIHIFDEEIVYSAKGNIDKLDDDHILEPYTYKQLGCFNIFILKTSHDASDPIGFIFESKEKLLYLTDTGYVTKKNRNYLHDLDYYIIESNHDVEMLMKTRRPQYLKQRILGDKGHLSNEYSASLMCDMIGDHTKEIILAHLSQDANTPEKALETYERVFNEKEIEFNGIIKVASQVDVVIGGSNED